MSVPYLTDWNPSNSAVVNPLQQSGMQPFTNNTRRRLTSRSSLPLGVFITFYFVTGVIGALLVTNPAIFDLWSLMYPTMDNRWLAPGSTLTYWLVVLGPLVIVPLLARPFMVACRRPAVVFARALDVRPSPAVVITVSFAMVAYCAFNLYSNGYLGVGLLSSSSIGAYQDNIIMRTQMMSTLGDLHFAIIYVGMPAVAITALYSAVYERSIQWWLIFAGVCSCLVWLYMSTLTKGNLIVFGVAVSVACYHARLVKFKGLVGFGVAGMVSLAAMDFLLSGADPFALVRTLLDVVFRISSGIPFYIAVFPEQVPYVGLDVGLGRLGIGPAAAANLVVANYMFPADTWVQSAAPAPAHVMAYAQGGIVWSLFTMVLIGVVVGFASALGRVARSPLSCSAFVGVCMTCYYVSQTEYMGAFQHSYGYLWWLTALGALLVAQRILQSAVRADANRPARVQA